MSAPPPSSISRRRDVHGKLPAHRKYPMLRKPFQRQDMVEVLRGIPGLIDG